MAETIRSSSESLQSKSRLTIEAAFGTLELSQFDTDAVGDDVLVSVILPNYEIGASSNVSQRLYYAYLGYLRNRDKNDLGTNDVMFGHQLVEASLDSLGSWGRQQMVSRFIQVHADFYQQRIDSIRQENPSLAFEALALIALHQVLPQNNYHQMPQPVLLSMLGDKLTSCQLQQQVFPKIWQLSTQGENSIHNLKALATWLRHYEPRTYRGGSDRWARMFLKGQSLVDKI